MTFLLQPGKAWRKVRVLADDNIPAATKESVEEGKTFNSRRRDSFGDEGKRGGRKQGDLSGFCELELFISP